MSPRLIALFSLLVVALTATPAFAQQWFRPSSPADASGAWNMT